MNSSLISTTPVSQPQCPSRLIFWQDDPSFTASPFVPSNMVKWFHERWYRFGRSNDLVNFIINNDDNDSDDGQYRTGLFATTIITGTIIFIWMSLILVYSQRRRHKLPGQKKQQDIYRKIKQKEVLLQYEQDEEENKYFGRPFSKPLPPREPEKPEELVDNNTDPSTEIASSLSPEEQKLRETRIRDYNRDLRRYQSDLVGWNYARAVYKRRINCTRITVVVGCLVVIIGSTLFYIQGAKHLSKAVQDSKVTLTQVQTDTQQEMDRIQGFLDFSQSSNITQILDHTNSYCPLVKPRICRNLLLDEDCDWSGIPHGSLVKSWISTLIQYQTKMSNTMHNLHHDLHSSQVEIDDWVSTLENMELGLTLSTIFVFLLDALCLYILLGVALAWSKRRKVPNCFIWIRSYCLIPLFALVVVVCWIFASTFVLASLTTSDFCHDGPTEKVVALVQRGDGSISPTLRDLIRHFVTSCSNVFVPDIFSSDINQLVQSVRDTKMLQSNIIIFANGDIKDTCGPFSESILSGVASMAEGELCQAASILHETRIHAACSTWNPIFTSLAQDMLCNDAMDAFAWITFSQLVIVFVSMVILTFRVAILPVKYVRWQPRARALSRQVTADLKKISALAQAVSQETLKNTKIEPVYHLGYASSSSSGTSESISDYAEVSTTEPSYYSDSNSLQNPSGTLPLLRPPEIPPKMVDYEEDSSESPKKTESNKTLVSSNQQQAAPIMTQVVLEMEEYESDDVDDEKKPESESLHSETIQPASQQSLISTTASSTPLEKPESYSIHSESVPVSQRSMTSRGGSIDSSVEDVVKPESAIRVLMAKGASVRQKIQSDDSSFEEITFLEDSDFEEATCYSMSSHKRTSDSSMEGSRRSNSNSERKSLVSGHSRRSERYLLSLDDVAEESPLANSLSPKPSTKVPRFAPGNAFMDRLSIDNTTPSNKAAKRPPKQMSLPLEVELGRLNARADTASSLCGSMTDGSKSLSAESESNALEASSTNEQAKLLAESDAGIEPPQNPERKDDTRRSSRSLRNLEEVRNGELTKGGDESFHFSLNLDMETYHSTDFGDFSASEGTNQDTFAAAEYEIIEEVIPPDQISQRNLRRSTSISALSVDLDDPAYTSFTSEELVKDSDAKVSSHSRRTVNGDDKGVDAQLQFQKELLWDTSGMQTKLEDESWNNNDDTTAHATASKHIDISALQQRVDSIRSLGSSSAGLPRAIDSEMLAVVDEAWTEDLRDEKAPSCVPPKAQMRNLVKNLRSKQRSWRADSVRSHGSGQSDQQRKKPWRADSVRSFGSGRPDQLSRLSGGDASMLSLNSDDLMWPSGSTNLSGEFEFRKPKSNRSLVSSPSIAISAATMNEKQFYLDDMGESSDSFGYAVLPSRAIDSEMLAVVDESWRDDVQDQEMPSSQQAKAHMRNLAKKVQPQPQQRNRTQPKDIFLQKRPDSIRSLGMDSFSGSMSGGLSTSLSDDFDNSFDKPKKPMSGLSLVSNSPSIAISAATLNEKQYRLDDMGGSSDSFGQAMLPSRAMDSEMLAVVDETWAEDAQESPSPAKKQLEMLYKLDEKTAPMTQ
ncbi:unnamed protein product [Cylindrotheca closterium]|uniref:Uncharacterized protein n=1 Tax=Cylindrotheca closterium TaxID=2856 RepID=A0AAD2CI81_9STRA|nr:unnamed protein product [Cylindrotheca closterium]